MFADTFQYRVRFVNEDKNTCVIEADAPVDIDKVRAFIAKTRRVFKLAEDADTIDTVRAIAGLGSS